MLQKTALFLIAALLLTGCTHTPVTETTTEPVTNPSDLQQSTTQDISYDALPVKDLFSDRDFETGYDNYTQISLQNDTAAASSASVKLQGSTVTITQEGTYLLSGTLDNGMILVDTDKANKVQLVLDGVSITSAASAPIYVRQADKVFITLAEGSENTLTNGGSFEAIDESNIDSVIFSKEDLTLNGSGKLTVTSPAGHGIVSKDDLRITGGSYTVSAAGHAMTGNDAVSIAGGTFNIECGKDGIQAENSEDATLGNVYICGGGFQFTTSGDGISAGASMQIDGGEFNLICGGGSQYGEEHTDDMFGGGMGGPGGMGRPGGIGWGKSAESTQENTTVSAKGLKAAGIMTLNGGSFTINSADDAVHSNNALTVNGGSFTIASGDDGFHADEALLFKDGTVSISESYEGLEGLSITITGGNITLKASDDGLNAAGGNDESGFGGMGGRPGGMGGFGGDMFGASSDSFIDISGGNLFVDADGDGIDSNGDLTFSGGYTVVEGPTNGGNGPLDYGGNGTISGGMILISGSSGMAQSLNATGTQGILAINVGSCSAGTQVSFSDSEGSTILTLQPQKTFGCVIVSTPDFVKGQTYTVTLGDQSAEFVA